MYVGRVDEGCLLVSFTVFRPLRDDAATALSLGGADTAFHVPAKLPLTSATALPHFWPDFRGESNAPRIPTARRIGGGRPGATIPRRQPMRKAPHFPRLGTVTVRLQHCFQPWVLSPEASREFMDLLDAVPTFRPKDVENLLLAERQALTKGIAEERYAFDGRQLPQIPSKNKIEAAEG